MYETHSLELRRAYIITFSCFENNSDIWIWISSNRWLFSLNQFSILFECEQLFEQWLIYDGKLTVRLQNCTWQSQRFSFHSSILQLENFKIMTFQVESTERLNPRWYEFELKCSGDWIKSYTAVNKYCFEISLLTVKSMPNVHCLIVRNSIWLWPKFILDTK